METDNSRGKQERVRPLRSSLARQMTAALLLLSLMAAGSVSFTLYELELRRHDYAILDLVGQLRVMAISLGEAARAHPATPDRQSAEVLRRAITPTTERFGRIVDSLRSRTLDPALTGRSDPLRCSWDEQAIAALDRMALVWHELEPGLAQQLAADDQLAGAARLILAEEGRLLTAATAMGRDFSAMMEEKMALIVRINQTMLLIMLLTMALLLWQLRRRVIAPLAAAVTGFERVSRGGFGHQIAVSSNDELGHMAESFNHLSLRLAALFRLTGSIGEGESLDETLERVHKEFSPLLDVDWIGLLRYDQLDERFTLERHFSHHQFDLSEGASFNAPGSLLERAMLANQPLHIASLAKQASAGEQYQFAARLLELGLSSALFAPLTTTHRWGAVLVFASRRPGAYAADHLELLGNIAGQISQGFERGVVTENLVISAVSGLAKLAESRDPETGDHLERMSRYTAVIANQLNRKGRHAGTLPPSRVRDLQRFAPMHDIGKVGIEDSILLKPGRLDPEERREMERHPAIGAEVLRECEAQMSAVGHSLFQTGIEIAEGHHEKFDGSGYPNRLQGESIPLSARIVAVADVFDALTSKRPYKEAWSIERAVGMMQEESGFHFDPEVIDAFIEAMPAILAIYDEHKHV